MRLLDCLHFVWLIFRYINIYSVISCPHTFKKIFFSNIGCRYGSWKSYYSVKYSIRCHFFKVEEAIPWFRMAKEMNEQAFHFHAFCFIKAKLICSEFPQTIIKREQNLCILYKMSQKRCNPLIWKWFITVTSTKTVIWNMSCLKCIFWEWYQINAFFNCCYISFHNTLYILWS